MVAARVAVNQEVSDRLERESVRVVGIEAYIAPISEA
jgi:hypothetical protein